MAYGAVQIGTEVADYSEVMFPTYQSTYHRLLESSLFLFAYLIPPRNVKF